MRVLHNEVMDYKNDRWAVHQTIDGRWFAAVPSDGKYALGIDEGFDNHAEAIAYADKEARK